MVELSLQWRADLTCARMISSRQVERAGLLDVEVVALRLYSGPMYSRYNRILREALSSESQGAGTSASSNFYPTTIHVLVSGICKLTRVAKMPEGRVVFRGLSGLALPPEFFEKDEQGFAGGVEASFMSTTTKEEVARQYSGVREGHVATIFRLELGKASLGADISWLSQFAGEAEMLFPPRTHLQILKQEKGGDGVSVITLKPTTFQNVSTVEEVVSSRKEGSKHLASSLAWDLRNEAVRDGKWESELAQRLDALEVKLISDHSSQAAEWYNDNAKYRGSVRALFKDAEKAREQIHDRTSVLCKSLAPAAQPAPGGTTTSGDASVVGAPSVTSAADGTSASSNAVAALHAKFTQDPAFRGIKATFASDSLYAKGIEAVVGPMDVQYVRAMFNEHNTVPDADASFWAWNAGNSIETTPRREWLFVVGAHGVDSDTWELDASMAEPEVADGMMVPGRNSKRLADLLQTPAAIKAGLSAAEIVAVRLYSGEGIISYGMYAVFCMSCVCVGREWEALQDCDSRAASHCAVIKSLNALQTQIFEGQL